MTEGNKNTLKDLAKVLGGMSVIIALMFILPDGSISQHIYGYIMGSATILGIIWFTPLSNPIRRLINKNKNQ